MTVIALPMLFPWLLAQSPDSLFSDGAPYHFDPVVVGDGSSCLVAGLAVILFGKGTPARVAVTGDADRLLRAFSHREPLTSAPDVM